MSGMTVEQILRDAELTISDLRKLIVRVPARDRGDDIDRLLHALIDAAEAEVL
ncbi:MAG: hypothetical protein WA210_00800 [Burkholderiaceae bacterium]